MNESQESVHVPAWNYIILWMSCSIIYWDLIIHRGIFCIKEVRWVAETEVHQCLHQSELAGENLLISLITSNFSEICQAVDHAAESIRRRREKLIHTVITRSRREAAGRENAIICLINSNFWWNVSSLVSFSVSAGLADYYNKTHLDQVTSIKTPQLSVNTLWLGLTGSVIQLFIFPSLSKLAGLFQSNLKTSEKEARQLASWVGKKWFQIVLSVNFLSGQRLARTMELNECFQRHTENGPDYHHQLPTKNYQKTARCILCWRILRDGDGLVSAGVLIILTTTDITLTVSTFKGSPASPSPPPADLHWANDLLADPHYSSRGYFCNLWFGLNKYVDKNTLLIDQNNMRWAVSALENDSLPWKIGPPSFSVVVGSDKAGEGKEKNERSEK